MFVGAGGDGAVASPRPAGLDGARAPSGAARSDDTRAVGVDRAGWSAVPEDEAADAAPGCPAPRGDEVGFAEEPRRLSICQSFSRMCGGPLNGPQNGLALRFQIALYFGKGDLGSVKCQQVGQQRHFRHDVLELGIGEMGNVSQEQRFQTRQI